MKARFSEWVLAGLGGVSLYSKRLWRHELEDGLRLAALRRFDLRRSGVRAKLGVNMTIPGELGVSRLSKEERTGSGPRGSSQKFPRRSVAG